jgi:hypothetical protein
VQVAAQSPQPGWHSIIVSATMHMLLMHEHPGTSGDRFWQSASVAHPQHCGAPLITQHAW